MVRLDPSVHDHQLHPGATRGGPNRRRPHHGHAPRSRLPALPAQHPTPSGPRHQPGRTGRGRDRLDPIQRRIRPHPRPRGRIDLHDRDPDVVEILDDLCPATLQVREPSRDRSGLEWRPQAASNDLARPERQAHRPPLQPERDVGLRLESHERLAAARGEGEDQRGVVRLPRRRCRRQVDIECRKVDRLGHPGLGEVGRGRGGGYRAWNSRLLATTPSENHDRKQDLSAIPP
jgi:hypothetical protein